MKSYRVIPRNGEVLDIMADDFSQEDEELFFWGVNGEQVAWFDIKDLIGFTLLHIYEEERKHDNPE